MVPEVAGSTPVTRPMRRPDGLCVAQPPESDILGDAVPGVVRQNEEGRAWATKSLQFVMHALLVRRIGQRADDWQVEQREDEQDIQHGEIHCGKHGGGT